MAKELPYFKFEPQAWDTGNVQMCSRESKGLFIDLCSLYWSRLGELPYALALQKLCSGNKNAMQELVEHEIIGIFEGQIVIEFLDEQLSEFNQTSEKRRNAANKRWKDASALQMESKSNAIREDKIREEEKRQEKIKEEDLHVWPSFEDFWDKYDKKVGKPKALTFWKKIDQGGREKIMAHLETYTLTEKMYRKDPERYLKNKCWEDEVITIKGNNNGNRSATTGTSATICAQIGGTNYDNQQL